MLRTSSPFVLSFVLCLLAFFLPEMAWAQNSVPDGTCTTDPQFYIPPSTGYITSLVTYMSTIVSSAMMVIYNNAIVGMGPAVGGALTLFVMIYAILFMSGAISASMLDLVIRSVKVFVVAIMVSPYSWTYFSFYVVDFFNNTTDLLINYFSTLMLGRVPGLTSSAPFAPIDNALMLLTSSRMWITLIAIIFTGPYGLAYGLLILMGIFVFGIAMFQAMWIYLIAFLARNLMFALAPIFICCILFNRTRKLFDGWLSIIISSCLQPVFLFTFFAFFAKLAEYAVLNILLIPVCWTPPPDSVRGTPFDVYFWRFTHNGEIYGGEWTFNGSGTGVPFPINLGDVLILWMMCHLAWKFNSVSLTLASQISAASTKFTMSGALGDWLDKGGLSRQQGARGRDGANAAAGGGAVQRFTNNFRNNLQRRR